MQAVARRITTARNHPKDPENTYKKFREKAGYTQATAAEGLSITEKSYAKYERAYGDPAASDPGPARVDDMATLFNAPELRNWYCRNVCPLGIYTTEDVTLEGSSLDIAAVKLYLAIEAVNQIKGLLLKVVADGELTDDEGEDLKTLFDHLEQVEGFTQEFRLWLERSKNRYSQELRSQLEQDVFLKIT